MVRSSVRLGHAVLEEAKEKQKIWFDEIRLYSLFATKNNKLNKGILYCICVSERKQGLQTASKRK